MIARTWTGTVRRVDAEEYAKYIAETGFAEYAQTTSAVATSSWISGDPDGSRFP